MIYNNVEQINKHKKIIVDPTRSLYKWGRGFHHIQKNFFTEDIKLRREKQIEDFISLNEFKRVKVIKDTDILNNTDSVDSDPDLIVITDQKFSRYPCPEIIKKLGQYLDQCPIYLCLNRQYINIDNSYHDQTLSDNYCLAISQWLRKELSSVDVLDLSLDVEEDGMQFTWVVPDRHYFIKRND